MDADLRDRIIGPVGAWLRGRDARAGRDPQSGIARPGGFLVAALTAAVVFFVGQQLIPRLAPGPQPAPVAATPPPTPPTPPAADAAARPDGAAAITGDAAALDARAGAQPIRDGAAPTGKIDAAGTADAAAPRAERKPAPADEEKPTPPAAASPATDKTEKQSDKDLAREAWRRNKPDLSVDGPRASLLIPLKGSSEGSSFTVINNPHAVVVKLPQAASMITMRLYKIEREGFRLVRINQAEKDAQPEDGTELKISLSDLGPPEVEVKDDFVRITVRRPSAPLPGGAATQKPAAADRNDGDQ